jgi:hypothetical protein
VRACKWALFALCIATLPLPFIGLENGQAPAIRLLFIGSLVAGVLVQDPDPIGGVLTAIYLGQGLLWSAFLYFVTRFAARKLAAIGSKQTIVLGLLSLVLIGASFFEIYRTPMSSSGVHSNILGVFD